MFCVATAYGEELLEQTEEIRVHTGRMDEIQMQACILELMKTGLQAVIDATPSHAVDVTENLKRACEAAGHAISGCCVNRWTCQYMITS